MRRYGVATPRGRVTDRAEEADEICRELGGRCVVKAQIHAGGRGKGGGVKLADSPEEARSAGGGDSGHAAGDAADRARGSMVRRVLVEEAFEIASELYLSVTFDRAVGRPIIMASASGGMDIEEVAAERPEAIVRQAFDPHSGPAALPGASVVRGLGLDGDTAKQAIRLIGLLAQAYLGHRRVAGRRSIRCW